MIKKFSHETRQAILGGVEVADEIYAERTPLHVDFSPSSNRVKSELIEGAQLRKPKLYNAIGSLASSASGDVLGHLPVIDVDGGLVVQTASSTHKAILTSSHKGTYRPTSVLRDVLGDNGIDLEVFQAHEMEHSVFSGSYLSNEPRVSAIVLRSSEDIFDDVESTQKGHSHLYIQSLFSESDHAALIDELCLTGIIGESWREIVEMEGMGVVRTPWTAKDVRHFGS